MATQVTADGQEVMPIEGHKEQEPPQLERVKLDYSVDEINELATILSEARRIGDMQFAAMVFRHFNRLVTSAKSQLGQTLDQTG